MLANLALLACCFTLLFMVQVANEFSSLHLLNVKVNISRLLSAFRHVSLRTKYDFTPDRVMPTLTMNNF